MRVENGTKWLYVGGEEGYDLVHTIVQVEQQTDPKMPYITTWSDVFQDEVPENGEPDGQPGITWRGPLTLFLKQFTSLELELDGEDDDGEEWKKS